MAKYASETMVSVERSKAEIESTLTRYGATQFMSGWDHNRAMIGFKIDDRNVRFVLPLPDKADDVFWFTPHRKNRRTEADAYREWEQACRQRWRALCLCIKAKLEAVDAGITTFEDEFMAHLVLPDGRSVSQWMHPQLEEMDRTGAMPQPILALPPGEAA